MGKGNDWLASLPELPGAKRAQMVVDAVSSGLIVIEWAEIVSEYKGHKATFYITKDAGYVTLDDGSRFRPQASASTVQKCADVLGAMLPTAKLMDLSYRQTEVKLGLVALGAGSDMVTTTRSKTFNQVLEKKRAGATGLIRDCGKAWILDNKLLSKPRNWACNHGFYDRNGPSLNRMGDKMYQVSGCAHNYLHEDYSQLIHLMATYCIVDDTHMSVADVVKDPVLSFLLNHDGILKMLRQPGT